MTLRILNERLGRGALLLGEVVQDHDLAWAQARGQHPLYKGGEDRLINGAPDQQALLESG